MTEWPKGAPGSDEAQVNGCRCPVLDNGHGIGYFGDGEQYGWIMTAGCPLHNEAYLRAVEGVWQGPLEHWECDVCQEMKPRDELHDTIAYGIETTACDDCFNEGK